MEKKNYRLGSDDYLMDKTDDIIGKLVVEKEHLFKAYNYYQGFRDKYQFQHLEKNYGVGNPTSIKFTPLVRKHVDAITGEYMTRRVSPKITCKDQKTLNNILRDKQLELQKQNRDWTKQFLENAIYDAIAGKPQLDKKTLDPIIDKLLKEIEESVNRSFISNYEIAALTIIDYALTSRNIDFSNKRMQLMLDLLIAGECYYKVVQSSGGTNFNIEVENPLNTFVFSKNDDRYMKNGTKCVVRHWLTKEEIAIKYGDLLSKEDLEEIENQPNDYMTEGSLTWIAAVNSRGCPRTPGILAGLEVTVSPNDIYNMPYELLPVYTVEWIDFDSKENKAKAYRTTRIGGGIYILEGENQDLVRSQDTPKEARLSLNGIYYTNRGVPYSLMLATADLLDLYDLLLYQKDNLIALSGTRGANVDVAHLPEFLGENMKERVLKYQAYRKMGLAFFDSSQEGETVNTAFSGYDDSVSVNAILAIQVGIQMIEETVSSITGVFRERLNGIQARDAVANVEVGMQQSYIITKLYTLAMDTIVTEMLIDCIDMAKRVYKKGKTGEIILGDQKQIFTLIPEYFTFTDYDIHLRDAGEAEKEQTAIQLYAMQLAQSNAVDIMDLVTIASSKSLTEMKDLLYKSTKKKKEENDLIGLLTQKVQEYELQMQQLSQQLEASTKKLTQLDEKKMAIEQENNQMKMNIEWYKAKADAEYKDKQLELIRQRTKLEAAQLTDDNKMNDEVRNDAY